MKVKMTVKSASLKRRVLNAGAWSVAGYLVNVIIRFGSNLILTRFLLPEAYGVMAVAMVFLAALALFSDIGLRPSVIKSSKGHTAEFLNTVWITQIVRGALLCFLAGCCALAVHLANLAGFVPTRSVYANPQVPAVIFALSFSLLIAGFESTKPLEQGRELVMSRLTAIDVIAQILSFAVMMVWIAFDKSIWSLVAGTLASNFVRTILSYTMLPGTANKWQWNSEHFKEVTRLGKWIFLSSALYFFASNGDRVVLGGLVDAAALGTYVIAYLFFSSIDQILTRIIVDVSFPALGEVAREQPARLKLTYYRLHYLIASFTYFAAAALFVCGPTIIRTLYSPNYHRAGILLQLLSVALLPLPFRAATQAFLLMGAARVYFYLNLTRTVSLFAAIPIGSYLGGLSGAVFGIVVSYFSNLPIIVYYWLKFEMFDFRQELRPLIALPAGAVAGYLVCFALGILNVHLHG